MRKNKLILLIVLVSLITSVLAVVVSKYHPIEQIEEYEMTLIVTDDNVMGFNVDPGGLFFGSISEGASVTRKIVIITEEDLVANIQKEGSMAEWVRNANNIPISAKVEMEIPFSVSIPPGTPLGNYTGKVKVILRKP